MFGIWEQLSSPKHFNLFLFGVELHSQNAILVNRPNRWHGDRHNLL